MGMIDLYTEEQAEEALEDAEATKKEFFREIESINNIIFYLRYYLATGDALDPSAIGIKKEEEDSDD